MRYDQVLTDIVSVANDPNGDRLWERAKDKFIEAVSHFILQNQYDEDDLPGYFKLKTDVDFGDPGNVEDLTALNIWHVDDVFADPLLPQADDLYGQTILIVDTQTVRRMSSNSNFALNDNEIYVWRVGDELRPLISPGNTVSVPLSTPLYMTYISFPDYSNWSDTDGSGTELTGKFSDPFLHACIARAGQMLLEEDSQ